VAHEVRWEGKMTPSHPFRHVVALLLAVAATAAPGQEPQRYGPWDRDLAILESSDGLRFGEARPFVERAGVPTLACDAAGRLVAAFQWFPLDRAAAFDRVAISFSEDGKTWTAPESAVFEGLSPTAFERPYDPTLVPLADGRIRMYFTSRDLAGGGEQAIYSAVTSDGKAFTFEPGQRFGVAGERVIDCAAVRRGKTFHLFAPVQGQDGRGYHAISEDGLAFRRIDDVTVPGRRSWLGCAVDTGDGLRFYGSGMGTWSAFSQDGTAWTVDEGARAKGADPGVAAARDGRILIVVTGDLRADAGRDLPEGIHGHGAPPGSAEAGRTGGSAGRLPFVPGAALVSDGTRLWARVGDRLVRLDPDTLQPIAEMRLAGAARGPAGSGNPGGTGGPDGPSGHRVLRATSPDGLTWTAEGKVVVEPASVPDALVGPDGRTRIWFVDPKHNGISMGVEGSDGTWTFQSTNLRGCDPNALLLADGTYRLYAKEGLEEARIIAAESRDGVSFGEPRTVWEDARYPMATDPDVIPTSSGWVMYLSLGPRLLLAESKDGLAFSQVRELDLGGSVGDTIAVAGGFRMFFHKNPRGSGERLAIWSAFSKDGREWQVEGERLRAGAEGPDRRGVGDAAVVRLADGSWRMYYKSFIER